MSKETSTRILLDELKQLHDALQFYKQESGRSGKDAEDIRCRIYELREIASLLGIELKEAAPASDH